MTELESRLESILFVAGEPVTLTALCAGLETDPDTLGKALARLEESYLREGRGLRLLYTDKTAQLTSAPENGGSGGKSPCAHTKAFRLRLHAGNFGCSGL